MMKMYDNNGINDSNGIDDNKDNKHNNNDSYVITIICKIMIIYIAKIILLI